MMNQRLFGVMVSGLILSGCTFLDHTLNELAHDAPPTKLQQTQGMEQRRAMDYYLHLNESIDPGTTVCYTATLGIGIPTLVRAHVIQWIKGRMRVVIKDVTPTGTTFHGIAMKAGDILDVEPNEWFLCRS